MPSWEEVREREAEAAFAIHVPSLPTLRHVRPSIRSRGGGESSRSFQLPMEDFSGMAPPPPQMRVRRKGGVGEREGRDNFFLPMETKTRRVCISLYSLMGGTHQRRTMVHRLARLVLQSWRVCVIRGRGLPVTTLGDEPSLAPCLPS